MSARAVAALVISSLLGVTGAQAAGLRAGGVLNEAGEVVLLTELPRGPAAGPGLATGELRFGFTPRAGSSLLLGAGEEPGRGLGLELGVAPAGAVLGRLEGLGLAALPRPFGAPADDTGSGLSIGGALAWSGWTVGGNYATGVVAGSQLDLWTGRVGYGPLTARLGYGQEATLGRVERELWLFGTDLVTGSWLTLEGDLAVTTRPDREPDTVGRIGLRLNF
ncbi:MAG: hypothetical protein K6T74_10935 [Geminicoccaceae bacterium]|nr:hypothetical protein [Geminicoccaceae bacterium]